MSSQATREIRAKDAIFASSRLSACCPSRLANFAEQPASHPPVPIGLPASQALGAHVLARWVPYYVYRTEGKDWPNVPVFLTRLLFYGLLWIMFAISRGFATLFTPTALLLLLWSLFRARKELGQMLRVFIGSIVMGLSPSENRLCIATRMPAGDRGILREMTKRFQVSYRDISPNSLERRSLPEFVELTSGPETQSTISSRRIIADRFFRVLAR
jgi:hypothetical protein